MNYKLVSKLVKASLVLGLSFLACPTDALSQVETLVDPQATFRVSPGDDEGVMVAMDSAGNCLLFDSHVDTLVDGDTNGGSDLFVYNKAINSLTLTTIGPNGGQAQRTVLDADISGDCGFVVFALPERGFPPFKGVTSKQGMYLRNLNTSQTIYVASGRRASISHDGRYIAFESTATDLIVGDNNNESDIFVYDRIEETITLVSKDSSGAIGNEASTGARISADGMKIAFSSSADNLVSGDNNGVADAFVHDLQSDETIRVSQTKSGDEANDASFACDISSDGSKVGFSSSASNLLPADSSSVVNVYTNQLSDASLALVSLDSNGVVGNADSSGCSMDSDGSSVAFYSYATNLVTGDTNKEEDLFLRNVSVAQTSRVDVTSSGGQAADGPVNALVDLSADGRFISYSSWADLETNGQARGISGGYVTSLDPDVLDREMRGLWNGYLNMVNILELVNKTSVNRQVTVRLRNNSGDIAGEVTATLAPQTQRDFILNDFPGFVPNSYGLVEVIERSQYGSFSSEGSLVSGALEARVFFYRPSATGGYEFAYGLPFINPLNGISHVAFNTYQPSGYGPDAFNLVYNWLSIVNLSPDLSNRFTVNYYSLAGQLLFSQSYSVGSGGQRVDIDGGHRFGPSRVGYVEIVPSRLDQPYLAKTSRYGENSLGGFDFAFPLYARKPLDKTWVGISSGGGGQNWVEIQNVLNTEIRVTITAHANTGVETASQTIRLAPRSGIHLEASPMVSNGLSGALEIESDTPASIIASSMFYFRDGLGRIEAMYGTQGGETIGGVRWGSWNLFLQMSNWLRLFNTSDTRDTVRITVYNGTSVVYDGAAGIDPLSGFDLGLHEISRFGTTTNNYGLVRVEADGIMSQLLRLRGAQGSAVYDFAAPTQVRR